MASQALTNMKPGDIVQRRSLQWAPTNAQPPIVHVGKMSKEEISKMWYNKNDYKSFEKECKRTVKLLKRNKSAESSDLRKMKMDILCPRGLEYKVDDKIRNNRCRVRKDATSTVLEEQSDQRYFGTFSPDFIAEMYHEVSAPSQEFARQQALEDEKEARACLEIAEAELKEFLKTCPPQVDPVWAFARFRSSTSGRPLLLRGRKARSLSPRMA